jgi:2-amino-4-hydroxy-6-hydroxymethyldihydropteridine diphosphokinase
MTSAERSIVYLSLGSNIDPQANLIRAIRLLRQKVDVLAVSDAYRTPPEGFREQDDFLNAAVQIATDLSPITLKRDVLDWIEQELGRVRDPLNKNAPRTIDLDISLWGEAALEYGEKPWRVPDPDIVRFAHVALPLAQIAPDALHPTERIRLREIAARFSARFERITLPLDTE